jgi:RNA polymerase sigma-70 factor (ECF subfamily)
MQKMRHFKALVNLSKPLYNHIRNIILNHDDTNVLQNIVFQNLKNSKEKANCFLGCATNEALPFKQNEKSRSLSETLQMIEAARLLKT